MKNKTISIFSILFILVIIIYFPSCKEENSLTNSSDNIKFKVIANDESGNPVPNCYVWMKQGANISTGDLELVGRTNSSGILTTNLSKVSCTQGNSFTLSTQPPDGDTVSGGCNYNNLVLYCCDSTVTCNSFTRKTIIDKCAKKIVSENLDISLCLDTSKIARRNSKSYVNQTGNQWTVYYSILSPALNELTVKGNNLTTLANINAGSSMQVSNGQSFNASYLLNSTGKISNYTGNVTIIATDTTTKDTCLIVYEKITINADSCNKCQCPSDTTVNYRDTVCVANTCETGNEKMSIPINVVNSSDCQRTFFLTKRFSNSQIVPVSINSDNGYNSISLDKGQKFSTLEIKFTPTAAKLYTDTLEYSVKFVNTFGQTVTCSQKLRVIVNLLGSSASCQISKSPSTSLYQCVNSNAKSESLCIKNNSNCKLPVTAKISGTDKAYFTITPSDTCIMPNQELCLKLQFLPTNEAVWANGRPNSPIKLNFTSQLQLSTNGLCDQTYNLTGTADTTCNDVLICLREYDGCSSKEDGAIFTGDFGFQIQSPIAKGGCDFYAKSIVPGTSAVLQSDNGGMFIATGKNLTTLGTSSALCPFVTQAYQNLCSQLPGAGTNSINITTGELFIFKTAAGKCCLMWFNTAFDDANNCSTICVNVCINF